MEATTLTGIDSAGLRGPTPLLRLASDERLVLLPRRGNQAAFEALVARYQSRLLAFCRHMLSSREDAEDVLQEVFAAAFNAMLADERAINVRPWLYRIARNRSLNHLRRTQAVGVDSMDIHLSEGGLTTADKVHKREEFRLLVSDVQDLPETQRTALLLREIDALSYEQIAEAMETTVPSVKSLLVRARVSLAEAAESRLLSCEEVREELGEVAEGLRRTSAPVRRHVRNCDRCATFRKQLRETNKALAAVFPVAPLVLLKKTLLAHLGTSAAAGGSTAAGGGGGAAAAGAGGAALQAGASALATKAAAGLAAAAIVAAGAVEAKHVAVDKPARPTTVAAATPPAPVAPTPSVPVAVRSVRRPVAARPAAKRAPRALRAARPTPAAAATTTTTPAPAPAAPKQPALVAAVAPLREQHEGDTTTPTETAGSTEQTMGGLAPGQSAPTEQPALTTQPSPQPQPSAEPSAAPAAAPTPPPAAAPEPAATPDAPPPAQG